MRDGLVTGDTVQERLANRLAHDPHGRAVAFYKAGRPVEWFSYRSWHERSQSVAASLSEEGLKKDDTCLIVLPSGTEAALTLTGALLLGAKPLMMAPPTLLGANSDLPRVLRHTLERTRAPVTVVPPSLGSDRAALPSDLTERTALLVAGPDLERSSPQLEDAATTSPDEVAAMQLTSGTTGLPKICVWSQRAVLAAIDGMAAAMELSRDDVCFNWTPLYHDMGLVNNFLTCFTLGVPVALMSPQDFVKRPGDWLRGLHETGATVTWAPNFGFALAAQRVDPSSLEDIDLSGVRGFWNAAERIHGATYERFGQVFSSLGVQREALRTNFGCAENIGGATFTSPGEPYPVEQVDGDRLWREGQAVPVPEDSKDAVTIVGCGKGHPWLTVKILDGERREVSDGMVGEIALHTPSRLTCYLGDERATAEAIVGDLLLTGDLGYLRDGELFWVGRVQERITVRGKKFDPSDFEPVLFDVAGLREGCFAAFGVADEESGTESVVIVSEVRETTATDNEAIESEIRRQVMSRLGVGVTDVVLVPPGTLTKTSSGKRRHRHFRRMYEEGRLNGEPTP